MADTLDTIDFPYSEEYVENGDLLSGFDLPKSTQANSSVYNIDSFKEEPAVTQQHHTEDSPASLDLEHVSHSKQTRCCGFLPTNICDFTQYAHN